MANQLYSRFQKRGKFLYTGIDVRHPPDLLPPGKTPLLLNVTPDMEQGSITARPAVTDTGSLSASAPINSISTRNDPLTLADETYVGDESGVLHSSLSPFGISTPVDSGYSGRPLSLVSYRPPSDTVPWMYVYDQAKQRKIKTVSLLREIGIAAPTAPPDTAISQPFYTTLIDAAASATGWTASGDAAVPTSVTRISGTTLELLYDLENGGGQGWACVAPAVNTPLQTGQKIVIGGEEMVVEQVFAGIGDFGVVTYVHGVAFESGAIGYAVVQFDEALQGIQRNSLITINGVYVRVISVTAGPDGLYSARIFWPVPFGLTPGQPVTVPPSFRVFTVNAHPSSGETINDKVLQTTLTYPAGPPLQSSGLIANIEPFDLSQLTAALRPLTVDDYMHFSFNVLSGTINTSGIPADTNVMSRIQEVHFLLDVDPATTTIANAFTRNYFYYVLRQGDFTPNTEANPQSALQSLFSTLGNTIASDPPADANVSTVGNNPYPAVPVPNYSLPDPAQMAAGVGQWFEAMFHLSQLTRVGTDETLSLAGVTAIGIRFIYTEINQGDTITVQAGNWWAGGGFGPDANFNSYGNQGTELLYRYRYRSSTTGAKSAVSPATRSGDLPRRQGETLYIPVSLSDDADLVDIERFGGSNTATGWHQVLTVPNIATIGSNIVVLDSVTEAEADAGQPLEPDVYQPWPVTGPVTQSIVNIVGTRMTRTSAAPFNVNWVRGTEVIVYTGTGGPSQTYTLYAPPSSPNTLDLAENFGVQNSVIVVFPDPTISATPLGRAWASHDGLHLMSVGDSVNPGRLYWTLPGNPDSARDSDYIEVTDPSEPLLNGCAYEGADYVWSNQSMYRIEATPGQVNAFASYKLGLTYGMAGAYAFTDQGPALFFVGFDGVYEYSPAGGSKNLTENDLWPVFPHESVPGLTVTIGNTSLPQPLKGFNITPPDYSKPDELRLSFADNQLFFDYLDIDGFHRTLVFNYLTKGWVLHHYGPPGITLHYQQQGVDNPLTLEGTDDGRLFYTTNDPRDVVASGPAAQEIVCYVTTPADDQDESRARKSYGDVMLDCVAGGGGVRQQIYYDNYILQATATPAIVSASRAQTLIDLPQDDQAMRRNIALFLGWFKSDGVTVYEWQPSVIGKVEDSQLRATDWYDGGNLHLKWIHGVRIYCNTFGVDKLLQVEYDGGLIGPVITINTAVSNIGETVVPVSFPFDGATTHPIKAHMIRLVPLDTVPWQFMTMEIISNIEPERVSFWIAQPTTFDMTGYSHVRDCQLAYATAPGGQAIFTVVVDPADSWGSSYMLPPFPDTGGTERKAYAVLPALKGKVWQVYATGLVQIYERDVEFRVKGWGETGPYRAMKPIGDLTVTNGGARL